MSDPAARFKSLFGALDPDTRALLQPLIDLAIEIATPGILQRDTERRRELREAMCVGRFRFGIAPIGTLDELHARLDVELLRILGEFYLGDIPAGAARAEIAVEFFKGDAQ